MSARTLFAPLSAVLLFGYFAGASATAVDVATYHNNAQRTGWNAAETLLTPGAVTAATFGLLHQISLDDQVDAQPLLVTGLSIGGATHDVVYVATESNTIYAVDASSGTVLLETNLGSPVPQAVLPGQCNLNGPNLGINSTPVIDTKSQTLYAMAYVYNGSAVKYVLHALNLSTLADKVTPAVVSASHSLVGGGVYDFTAASSRQRAALVEANGTVYAAFASFCDHNANTSRGWLLGWNASTLAPASQMQLTNTLRSSPNDAFLTAIWMSGFGPAWDGAGNLYFVTGNSDQSGTSYDKTNAINLSESVVAWSTTKNRVVTYFSPTDAGSDVATLDEHDKDFGSGGVMLLPKQPGSVPLLAVAAGKAGILYLMNRSTLGGENSGAVVGEYSIGGCYCGPSYFKGADGVGRVVSSGGNQLMVWKVQTSPTTGLVRDTAFASPTIPGAQSPGFFTSVSSNGSTADSAIIWAVSRPANNNPADVDLYAFDATTGTQLYSGTAGTWPAAANANANIVPTVANGKVYVGSYKALSIFGLAAPGAPLLSKSEFARPPVMLEPTSPAHRISGVILSTNGLRVVIQRRDGGHMTAELGEALRRDTAIWAVSGAPVLARGDYDADGILHVESFQRIKPQSVLWGPDR